MATTGETASIPSNQTGNSGSPKLKGIWKEIKRSEFYQTNGWTVLRFWDFEVKRELEACLKMILNYLH